MTSFRLRQDKLQPFFITFSQAHLRFQKQYVTLRILKILVAMENKQTRTASVPMYDADLMQLADIIVAEIEAERKQLAININQTVKRTYWNVGKHIVEFEQKGNARAKYGTHLLTSLAKILMARVGRGYSRPNLNNMRKYYLLYPICQTSDIFQTSEKLTWSHICELITIDNDLEREFYEKECIAENWTVDALHRQKESGLFMRLAQSKDKEGILQLAHKGQNLQKVEDVVKDTYTLEFLGIDDNKRYKESELEQKLIDNMQTFNP